MGQLGFSPENTAIENDSSATCLCTLKIDQAGQYVASSFALSSFALAIGSLAHAGSIGAKLDVSELEEIQTVISSKLLDVQEDEAPPPLSRKELNDIFALSCEKTMIEIETSLWSRRKEQHANKAGEFPTLDPSTELMQSFYLKNLARIKRAFTDNVDNYVQAMIEEGPNRIQINTDVAQIQRCLVFSLGAWPSQYSPSLMQQIGINLATSGGQTVFSVNRLPGTGKTVLLKEIVASNIVQRTIMMDEYDTPDQAFQKESTINTFSNPTTNYLPTVSSWLLGLV